MKKKHTFPHFLLLLLIFVSSLTYGATKTFTGTGNFSTGANWGGSVPAAGDVLIINGTCTFDNSANNLAYASLTVGGASIGVLNWPVGGTNTLNVTTISSSVAGSSINMTNGGTLQIRSSWTTTNMTFTAGTGTIHWNITSGNTVLPAAITTYYNLQVTASTRTVTLGANTIINNNLTMTSGTLLLSTRNFTVSGTATLASTITDNSTTGTNTINNININTGGSINNSSATTMAINGTATLNGGSITGSITATINIVTLLISGTSTIGAVTINVSGSTTINGTLNMNSTTGTKTFGSVTMANGSSWACSVAATIALTSLTMNGGTINGTSTGVFNISGDVNISSNTNTWGRMQVAVTGTTTVSSTLNINSTTGTKAFGNLTVNSSGTYNCSVAHNFSISGNLSVSGSFTSGTGIYTFSGTSRTIDGTATLNRINVSGSITNNGTVSCATSLTGAGSFTQGATGTLNMGITSANFTVTTFNASTSGNTVNYSGTGAQAIRNPTSSTYHHLGITGSGTKTLAATTNINGDLNISNASGVLDVTATPYNINIGGNWANAGTFTYQTGLVTFNGTGAQQISKTGGETFYNLTIGGSATVTLASNITVTRDLNISSTLVGSSYTINLTRNWSNTGTFTAGTSTLVCNGSAASQTIGGASNSNFYNLTISNSFGVSITSAQDITGTLTVSAGTFTTTGQTFTLVSNASGTARIAALVGSIAGNITMQRYVSGSTNWRLLSSPVSGRTLADWNDDFIMSGFTGTDFPSESFISVYTYNEATTGDFNNGYTAATNTTNAITTGVGYQCYTTGSPAYTLDVSGTPNTGAIPLPVTYNDDPGQPATQDGWNIVGNPYPSNIDWNSGSWTKTNVENAVYMLDPATGAFASYVAGSGTNGGSNIIPSSQGFWVQTNANSPVLSVTENVKTATSQTFFKVNNYANPSFKLKIEGNNYSDETVIRFDENATDQFDGKLDAVKLYGPNNLLPHICSSYNSSEYAINTIPFHSNTIVIPIKVKVGVSGEYTILRENLPYLPTSSCILLKDIEKNITIDLKNTSSYRFFIANMAQNPRFELIITAPIEKKLISNSCKGSNNGSALVTNAGNGLLTFIWKNNQQQIIRKTSNTLGKDSLKNLTAGTYEVEISGSNLPCGTIIESIEITEPETISADFIATNSSCQNTDNGKAKVLVSGGTEPYTINWTNGETTDEINNIAPGNYTASIVDASGCIANISGYVASSSSLFPSFISTEIDGAIQFKNQSKGATSYKWDFGDGSDFNYEENPVHSYAHEGNYNVVLTAYDDLCEATASIALKTIADNTTRNMQNIQLINQAEVIALQFSYKESKNVTIDLYNSMGQKVQSIQNQISSGIVELSKRDLPYGVYIVKIVDNKTVLLSQNVVHRK